MASRIKSVTALEILSSSGKPTVQAQVETEDGIIGGASVPIGSSRGKYEAHYLYDGDWRFQGLGVRQAVANVNGAIASALKGADIRSQKGIDDILIKLDGSGNKSVLGANAILAVSLAAARAGARENGVPLFRYLGGPRAGRLPTASATVLAGGKFSPSELDFEDYLYVLNGFDCFMDALEALVTCYYRLAETIEKKYGPLPTVGGGAMAPPLRSNEEALDFMLKAAGDCGYGGKMGIGLDIVGGELTSVDDPSFRINNGCLSRDQYLAYLKKLSENYPIVFLEDPFGEDDFESFSLLTAEVGDRVMVVGDDLFVTNIQRLSRGIEESAGNSLLLKMNQIGTLSEALAAGRMALDHDFQVMVSVRSSDTNDPFAADLSVALPARYIKIGSPVSGEKVAKYNRLLEIAAFTGS